MNLSSWTLLVCWSISSKKYRHFQRFLVIVKDLIENVFNSIFIFHLRKQINGQFKLTDSFSPMDICWEIVFYPCKNMECVSFTFPFPIGRHSFVPLGNVFNTYWLTMFPISIEECFPFTLKTFLFPNGLPSSLGNASHS